jgi:hypothetical protein
VRAGPLSPARRRCSESRRGAYRSLLVRVPGRRRWLVDQRARSVQGEAPKLLTKNRPGGALATTHTLVCGQKSHPVPERDALGLRRRLPSCIAHVPGPISWRASEKRGPPPYPRRRGRGRTGPAAAAVSLTPPTGAMRAYFRCMVWTSTEQMSSFVSETTGRRCSSPRQKGTAPHIGPRAMSNAPHDHDPPQRAWREQSTSSWRTAR